MPLTFDYLRPDVPTAAVLPPIPGTVPIAADDSRARKFRRRDVPVEQRTPQAQRFYWKKRKAKLRPILFAADPHCSSCRKPLQIVSPGLPDFASVLSAGEVLVCSECLSKMVVHRDRKVPADSAK